MGSVQRRQVLEACRLVVAGEWAVPSSAYGVFFLGGGRWELRALKMVVQFCESIQNHRIVYFKR